MGPTVATLRPAPLTAGGWDPFGWLPLPDSDPLDGARTLEFAWGDPHVNFITHHLDELEGAGGTLACRELFRHETHTQVLMPLDQAAVVVVAPSDDPLETGADIERVRAFVLRPLDAVVLAPGTWHWGPFPVLAPSVRLFNVQGRRYREDNARVDLSARGLGVHVVVGDPEADGLNLWAYETGPASSRPPGQGGHR